MISAFVVCCIDSIIALVVKPVASMCYCAGLCRTWSETFNTFFLPIGSVSNKGSGITKSKTSSHPGWLQMCVSHVMRKTVFCIWGKQRRKSAAR